MSAKNISYAKLCEMVSEGRTVLVDFWAPWCGYCRRIGPAYDQIAEQYDGFIDVVKVNMDEEQHLWDSGEIELIPTLMLYRNGQKVDTIFAPETKTVIEQFLQGAMPAKPKDNGNHIHDMIIIGGGPGGYTAALYAARDGMDALLLEKLSAGGQMALTHQVDNYPGYAEGIDGFELAVQMQKQAERFGARTMNCEVVSVNLTETPKRIETTEGTFLARSVVVSTGANPRLPGLPREQEMTGRGVAYCAACDGMFYKGKTVAVIGGGNSAVSDALLLSRIAQKVIIIHRRDKLRATKVYHSALDKAENVFFEWNHVSTALVGEERISGIRIKNVKTGIEKEIECDGVFVSIGRKPSSELVLGQLEIDENGYIIADETTQTGIAGVYAVGDVRTKQLRQVITAASDGAVALHMAEEYLASLE